MEKKGFSELAQLGQAFWGGSEMAIQAVSDTAGAMGFLGLTESRGVEKACGILVRRAAQEARETTPVELPFYRLTPQERLILTALHELRWSYGRLARCLDWSSAQVASRAWTTRLHLASLPGLGFAGTYPSGSSKQDPLCPEYDPRNPWTQKFMDDETSVQERLFLQDHLRVCKRCVEALTSCRKLYYFVDGLVPRLDEAECLRRADVFQKTYRKMWVLKHPSELTLFESLSSFFLDPKFRLALGASTALLVLVLAWRL